MNQIEKDIIKSRQELDKWLHEVYGKTYGDFYGEQDIGYEDWSQIEKCLKPAFEDKILKSYSKQCLQDILFLISRSNQGGRLIAWLHPKVKALSHIANLSPENFILLCEHALNSPSDDCDYQLANCFYKFDNLSEDQEKLLIRFFNTKDIYTKRLALNSLTKHRVDHLETYINQLWETGDEWAQVTCLDALKTSQCNHALFKNYLSRLLNSDNEYVRINAENISQS